MSHNLHIPCSIQTLHASRHTIRVDEDQENPIALHPERFETEHREKGNIQHANSQSITKRGKRAYDWLKTRVESGWPMRSGLWGRAR
jgi:hypothetical protein